MMRGNTVYANFNNNGKEKNVKETIEAFFEYKCKNNNTRLAYQKDIEMFFDYLCKKLSKPFELITEEDLYFEIQDVVKYRNKLEKTTLKDGVTRKYKNASINRKIATLKSLFDWFASNGYKVNSMAFKLKDLSTNDSEERDAFTWDEVHDLIKHARELAHGGEDKAMFIKLAATTGVRLTALSKVTWGDIKIKNNIAVMYVLDKEDKINKKPLHPKVYDELLQLKGDKTKTDRIFKYSVDTYQDTVKGLCKEIGIDEDRNLSFHSLKKSGATRVYNLTNNPKLTQEFADHSCFETTSKAYIKPQQDLTQMGSYILGEELDLSKLESVSRDELIAIIKSCGVGTQNEILSKITSK